MPPLLFAQDLQLGYLGQQALPYVLNWAWPSEQGRFVALLGRNGSGKSTLLRCIAGELQPQAGQILLQGRPPRHIPPPDLARLLALVHTEKLDLPYLSVRELVLLGRSPYLDWWARPRQEDQDRCQWALEIIGIAHLAARPWNACSDGEKQLAMLARALAQDTPLLLLDEPTAHLDYWFRRRLHELLRRLAEEEGKIILAADHDLDLALRCAQEVICLQGQTWFYGSTQGLSAQSLFQDF